MTINCQGKKVKLNLTLPATFTFTKGQLDMIDEYDGDNVIIDEAQCLRETEKAILVVLGEEEDRAEHWIPKSQIHDDSEVFEEGGDGNLIITKWIACERGLWEKEED